jgi:hypothetical protein
MGIEYCAFNHKNCTIYELGKGPWYDILDAVWKSSLDPDVLALSIEKRWNPTFEGHERYTRLIAEDLLKFVRDTPEDMVQVYGDCGDEHWMALSLGYVCIGSRYCLGDDEENRKSIEDMNDRSKYELSASDVEYLRGHGRWNFTKLSGVTNG